MSTLQNMLFPCLQDTVAPAFEFLNRYNPTKFPYKTCPCGSGIQVSIFLLMNGIFVNSVKRNDIAQIMLNNRFLQIDSVSDQKNLLLSWSRFPGILDENYLAPLAF